MKQYFIDRSYLNAQENFRISFVKNEPICVLNDSISKLEFNKILASQNGKFQINKEKYAGDNLITNCLMQDNVITKTMFRTNSEILETRDEAAKVTECLQRHPIVLLTRLDSEKFGQLFFDKICMNSVEINNNNTKTAENFQFSSSDKVHFSENVAKDSNMFLPQKIEVAMMSESALNRSDTNDIVPVCSPTSSVDKNEDQPLPLVISEARWNAKDNFYDNKPIKGNQSDNASDFNSNIVDSNVVEPFFSLLEAIESNNHTGSKVSQSAPSKKTSSVTNRTMLSECSLPIENIPVSGVSCSVDKVSDSDFRFRGPIYERSMAKDNHSDNFDKCLLPKLNSRKHLRSRRKCHQVVNYSDDFLLDCLLDNMDKAHKKSRRNKSRNLTPFMKEIRKKTAVYSKYRKRSELGISSGQRFDSGNKITQKRTNTVLDSLATHENNVHEEVKPIKILLFDTSDEIHTDETYERKIGDKGNLKDTKLSSSSLKSERKYTSKASRMRAVFQKLEKEINFSLTATCSRKKTLASDEESTESIILTRNPKEAKPQSTSLDLSNITKNDKSFSVETHFLQKRSSQGLRRERKHRKRGNKVASQCLSPDHSHDQQACLSKKTKKRRWQMNDDEAPLKRLARELPRFNWLEDKIKNSSQTCFSQLVKETKTEKSVETMDNSSVLKNKVVSNNKFDENISGAAQSRSSYTKTYDIKSNFKDIENSMETVENGSDYKERNTSGQWQTFYKEIDVLPQTGWEKESSNLPANQLLPYELSDQSVPSDDQKQGKSIVSPPLLYRHTPSPVLKVQQELTMDSMEPTNSKTLNMDEVLTKNAKDNFQAMMSTLDQDLQQETSIVHKDLGSSSSKFRSIRPKIDPIFISRKPFFSFTKPTEAEYYIPKLATEEFNGFESLKKRGLINTVCSVQDSVLKQGEKVDSQFGSKDSSLTEDDVYERESHKLGSLQLYEHDLDASYKKFSSVKSIISFPSSNKIEGTIPTADDLTDYSKETMENDTKLNHTVSQDIVLSSERLVKTTDLDGHLPRGNSEGHLHEYICPSVTYDVVAQGSTKGSVVSQQNENTASHTLVNSNKFKTPITSHDDISFKQITFSEPKQKTGQHSSRFQVTKSSPLNQTLESKSSPKNDQSCKELSSSVGSQGNNLTYQQTSKHYHSEEMSGSDSRNNSDFSQSNEDSSACNEHQKKQFNQQPNVHDGKSKGIIWKDSDVLSEHMNKQEDSAGQLLRRTGNITSLSPKVPNMSAHSIELKSQAIQTFDENSKGLLISPFTSVEEIQQVISDDQFSRNNSINTTEKLANQHRNLLVDNNCHLRKEISRHKENNFYKSKACRLEKDSLNSSNSAGYLSLKRKRLLNYAMDREREISENQEDETKFGMEKTENSIDDATKPSLKPQLHNEKIENAIEDNEIQVIFEIDKTEITHQNNNDNFLKLASSDTKLAPCEIVENWSDKKENSQDKSVSYVGNSQNQNITRLVGGRDKPKKILVTESLSQKHRNKKQSVNRKSQTESGLAESPNIPININDSPKRSTSPSFFIETCETSVDKRQNECSLVTKERHGFRSLKEEMQTRKKELIILDNLAKQRENEYKELLRTRKEKYKLLLMLEQCFPKLHDSPPKLEHRDNKPIKNENLSIDKWTKETNHTLEKALDLHPEKAQEKQKNPVFNIESHSMETKSAIFNKGGFTNHHTSDTDALSNLKTANATISSWESDSDKRVVDASNLSWSIRDLKTKGVYSHTLSSTAINPLNSKPVPLVQPHFSTTSPQLVPPVSIGNDLNSVLNSCLNTSKWIKHEQTSNGEKGKNPIEKKITSPSATAVVPVTGSSFNLSEVSGVKQQSISDLDHHAFYRNHMTSLSNFYSTHPSFQSNFIGEQKNTNCEVCEKITGCSANKHNSDVCYSRYYVQHQNSIKRHEHKNENRNQNLTVRPNMFPHHTAINPLLIPPLSGFGEPNKVVHSLGQESTEKLRTSPESLHGSCNQNFITSNQNIGSRMPVAQRSEVTMNNCRSSDVSSLTRLMPMMSSNRSRVNVRPLIQQFPHHTVQQYSDVSNIINPQALSSENPLQSAWPQQQMMINYPLSQSLEYLSKDTKVIEKHHSIFNSNHQSQSSNPHCGFCGKKAIFMCSGCKQNWYCGEPCQVKHWPTHSRFCRNLNHCV